MTVVLPALAGLVVFAVTVWAAGRRRARWIARRIDSLSPAQVEAAPTEASGRFPRLDRLFVRTEAKLSGTRVWRHLDVLVARAAVPLRTVELVYAAGAAATTLLLVGIVAGSFAIGLVLALAALGVIRLLLGFRAAKRAQAFEDQLPELLSAVAGALRAGHGFLQALQAITEETPDPARGELRRVLAEARLGRPLEQALSDLGQRMASQELQFVLDAVVIQRQVGGSLAGVFEIVAETARERQQFVLKVRSLTAMGRMSSRVLLALPVAVAVLLSAMNPGYMSPIYQTSTGHMMLAAGLVLMVAGWLFMRRIVVLKG